MSATKQSFHTSHWVAVFGGLALQQKSTLTWEGADAAELTDLFTRLVLIATSGCLLYSLAMLVFSKDLNRVLATLLISAVGPLCLWLFRRHRH